MNQKTAFVTGGTGFLGFNLVDELVTNGWRVTALHRTTSDLVHLKRLPVERVVGDITDPRSLEQAMPEGVGAVFHVAGNVNLWSRHNAEQTRDNVEGTRNMVVAALNAGANKFIHTSTISVYDMKNGRITEDAPKLGARSWINYQRTKYLAEEEVRRAIAQGLDAVILNPANIIGAYDRGGWARMIKLVHAGKLPGVPPGAGSFCHIGEVAKAHIAAAEQGRSGENYLLGGTDATYLEMVRIIGDLAGRKVPSRAVPASLVWPAARISEWYSYLTGSPPTMTPEAVALVTKQMFCDSSKAERELGYKAVELRVMLEESYRWLEGQGLLAAN